MVDREYESRFLISLPGGWENQTVYYFSGPSGDNREHTLMLEVRKPFEYENLRDFARACAEPVLSGFQTVEVLKNEEVTIENGLPVWEFIFKRTSSDDATIVEKMVFAVEGGLGFAFSIDFSAKSYQALEAGLSDVINSILPGTYKPIEED